MPRIPHLSAFLLVALVFATAAPAANADIPVFPQVSAAQLKTCGIKTDSTASCWGSNYNGQITIPSDLGAVRAISANYYTVCAVKIDSTLQCWGDEINWGGSVPGDMGTVRAVSTGDFHGCAIKTDSSLACWGNNGYHGLDLPPDLGSVNQVSVGRFSSCAVKADFSLACWGNSRFLSSTVPEGLDAPNTVSQVSTGGLTTCAVKTDDTVGCWGDNTYGQITIPAGLGTVRQVSTGFTHVCAVKTDQSLVCWGSNTEGQTTIPTDLGKVRQVSSGLGQTCAVKINAAVVCWGNNSDGQATPPTGGFPSFSGSLINFGDTSGLDFGDVRAGERSAVLSIPVLSRSGQGFSVPLAIKSVDATNPADGAFSVVSQTCTSAPLENGSYCMVRVRFTPTVWQRGDLTGQLTIADDSAAGSHTIPLSGTALTPPSFALKDASWLAAPGGHGAGVLVWTPSETAKVTITITQPVTTFVTVKKGKKTTKKAVTTIKPVALVANKAYGIPVSDGIAITPPQFSWDGKIAKKAAAKGNWTVTITAVSARGKATATLPVTIS